MNMVTMTNCQEMQTPTKTAPGGIPDVVVVVVVLKKAAEYNIVFQDVANYEMVVYYHDSSKGLFRVMMVMVVMVVIANRRI